MINFLYPNTATRTASHRDGATVLDLKSGNFLSLNIPLANIWNIFLASPASVTLDELYKHWARESPPTTSNAYFLRSVNLLIAKGLVATKPGSPVSPHLPHFLGWLSFLPSHLRSIALVYVLGNILNNKSNGYATLRAWYLSTTPRRRNKPPTSTNLAEASAMFRMALRFYGGHCKCLQKATFLAITLRWLGVESSVLIGVNPLPFQAHAWAEVGGTAIEETIPIDRFELIDRW